MFFIVTTGRSGSTTIANILDQHPLCRCTHEPNPILVKLATEWCHKEISNSEMRRYLFRPKHLFPHHIGLRLYGESDQKLSYLIPLLLEIGRHVKFIWLIRDGRDVVSSAFARGWYSSEEIGDGDNFYAKYRIRGDYCGDVSSEKWSAMSPFEKCCWYWSYTNRIISIELGKLSHNSWMMLHIEDLPNSLDSVLLFLDLPWYPLREVHLNRSNYPPYDISSWTLEERYAFDRFCGREMDIWYSGWRTDQPMKNKEHIIETVRIGQQALKMSGSFVGWGIKSVNRYLLRNLMR